MLESVKYKKAMLYKKRQIFFGKGVKSQKNDIFERSEKMENPVWQLFYEPHSEAISFILPNSACYMKFEVEKIWLHEEIFFHLCSSAFIHSAKLPPLL